MCIRKNNSGITLVELIISMAIAAIVFSIIAIMINTAAKGFKRSNEDVNLQMEAQIAINQLSTIIMESNGFVEPTDDFNAEDTKYLLDGTTCYSIYFDFDEHKLYLVSKTTVDNAEDVDPTVSQETEYQYLMAEHVIDFSIDHTEEKTANIVIEFGIGNQTYTANKKVKLRNK